MKHPFTKYRPIKAGDSEGGYHEELVTSGTIWGNMIVHKGKTTIIVDALEDVEVGDILVVGNIRG